MLLLTNDDVRQVLTMPMVMDALRQSYLELIRGEAVCRPNINTNIPIGRPDAFFKWSTMEGGSANTGYFAMRLKSDIWYRHQYESERHQVVTNEWYSARPGKFCGLIFLVRTTNAEILAIMHDSALQRARVGADGAIGTDYLARKDAQVMGILGSGGTARAQLAATLLVRRIKRLQIFSPTKEHRERFAREAAEQYGIEAVALEDGHDVFRGADIVAACADGGFVGEENHAIIIGRWLEPGTHYTDVGGGIDSEARRRTDLSLVLGRSPGPIDMPTLHDSSPGHVLYAVPTDTPKFKEDKYFIEMNSLQPSRFGGPRPGSKVVFLADLLAEKAKGRTSPEQITYSTRGNIQGAQFHAVAGRVFELARAQGLGHEIPTDWFLQDERN
jgi:ornithine cyclodeaminase/alanine dehydrogenase-like protein (mu-crystallin family)